MKDDVKRVMWLFCRYVFIALIGLGNLYLFYKVLTPATIFVVQFILSLFTTVFVEGNIIVLENFMIELIPACVAGSAFFLLFLLVFTTANIKPVKRIYVLLTAVILLFVLNVARILFLISIAGKDYFEIIHWTIWNLVSIFFVVAIWFFTAWMYKVESIPIYSDFLLLKGLTTKKDKKDNVNRSSKKRKKFK